MVTHPIEIASQNHNKYRPASSQPVVVVLGQPDDGLIVGFRTVGLSPIAEEGEIVIWGKRLAPDPTPAPPPELPQTVNPAGLLMTIADAALALGIGRSTVYELIGRGQLEVVHVGRSARVPTDALKALVLRLRLEQAPADPRAAG